VNIFFVRLFLDQGGLRIATLIMATHLFWARTQRDSFSSLLQVDARPTPQS
jgi:hypothetical protein